MFKVVENGQPTGERFEVVQSMSDEPLTKHPESGKPVRRVILPLISAVNTPTER